MSDWYILVFMARGGDSHTWAWQGRGFRSDDLHFREFQSDCVPILYLKTFIPSFCRKIIGLSPSNLTPEILGHKGDLIVQQNVLFNRFFTFCINFLFDFWSNWPLFHWPLIFIKPTLDLSRIPRLNKGKWKVTVIISWEKIFCCMFSTDSLTSQPSLEKAGILADI